jgi:MATE family multidrug resistance protein
VFSRPLRPATVSARLRRTMTAALYRRELRELFRLALPLAAAQAGMQLMGLVDVAVLGRYGAVELAGAGLANAVFFAAAVIGAGIVFGIDPLVSQARGAGDHVRARLVFWQGIWLGLAVSVALTLVLLAGTALIPFIGAKPELTRPATVYLLVRTLSVVPFLLFYVCRSYLQAYGKTRPMLVAMIAANVLNVFGDILFVFGGRVLPEWAGPLRSFPEMGVAGAALATVLCSILQVLVVARAVQSIDVGTHVDHRVSRADVGQAFHVGLPIGLHMGAEVGIFALVALLAGRLGTLHLAAHQLVIGLASFTFTIAVGVASAGTVRVGAAIGARDTVGTRIAGHATFIAGVVVMGTSALAFALAPRAIARIVTDQPAVIAAAVPLLLVAAVFQLSDGVQAVGAGVLRGAGDTKFTFYANMVGHWGIGLPVALYLGFSRGMGIVGLWWGLCAGLTAVAAILLVRFELISRAPIVPLDETLRMRAR